MNKKTMIAICYDFDKTLSPKDMQEYGFIDKLGISANQFWGELEAYRKLHKMDPALSFMYFMVHKYKECGLSLTQKELVDLGKNIELYKGVDTWFKRINDFAKSQDVELEHYIISSGNYEIISGTKIAKEFKEIFASRFIYNEKDEPIWPAIALNYTNKTQFLYRINKGIFDITDNSVNNCMSSEDRRIPFANMIYIGDSLTDVPCMRLVYKSGGAAIGVYNNKEKDNKTMIELATNNRINYFAEADYSKNSELENTVKDFILKIKYSTILERRSKDQKAKFLK